MARTSSGRSHHNTLSLDHGEYPFVLFAGSYAGFDEADRFTLISDDGAYRETLTLSQATRGPLGHRVLWFPAPPDGPTFGMLVEPVGHGGHARPYWIFRREPLTYGARA